MSLQIVELKDTLMDPSLLYLKQNQNSLTDLIGHISPHTSSNYTGHSFG